MEKKRSLPESARRLFSHYKNSADGSYIIDLNISRLEQLFSPYDPSPLSHRDIDPQVMKFILEQIVVFPDNVNVELHIHLPKSVRKKKLEKEIEQAVKHHFEYELLDNELHLERRLKKGTRTFSYASVIFMSLIVSSYLLDTLGPDHVILHLVAEGLMVGAWVSLWHPIETLLYDWLPLYEEKKKFSRLMDVKIIFNYV